LAGIRKGLLALGVAGAVLGGASGLAGAGPVPDPSTVDPAPVNAKIAAKKAGPYANTFLQHELSSGDKKTFHVKVKNLSGAKLKMTAFANLNGTSDYKEKFFKGSKNISDDVDGAGFAFGLGPDGKKRFRLVVRATGDEPLGGRCLSSVFQPEGPSAEDSVHLELNGLCQ
jgi:hypothetical protein